MELTAPECHAMCEIQHNITDSSELDAAIAELRPEALKELREDCRASIDRQTDVIRRVNRRLAGN
jgi:hypothetical protein